jgi:hypothetical protein
MKRIILLAAAIALLADAGAASAKTSHQKARGVYRDGFVQRNVALPRQTAPLPNADLKYGPYPEYPQSPPGVGGN